ncbi:uncharacterized protein LOC115630229 [Scaptodrosophila lebanonensis]|uniref:Regulatory protein zeste n=1 Tax=Drosophila lebanonensis TaxID=7225 RepID=A0A6J2SZ06_DROLE|nr:uncharacterized protein LOC115620171 [Scaptodrosophila lebanonensis]XP_030382646.1 uncharacterized protein LOC115630229 [Scaptodrosophila lebanonensis]
MDRRKKRTSTDQYMMYIEMMENDPIFASGRVPRDYDIHYLTKKWKDLSDKLNKCSSGPTLTAEEWRKRLNDWKNTTRCKYRRSLMPNEKDITMSALELKALDLFGKVPTATNETLLNLKAEKEEQEEDMEHQRTSESFQKELQAAVEEAINDEVEEIEEEEHVEQDDLLEEPIHETTAVPSSAATVGAATTVVNTGGGTYRTIVVDSTSYVDEEPNAEPIEFIPARRSAGSSNASLHTVVNTSANTAAATKLINGELPVKRMRTQARDQIIYEVKNASRSYATLQTAPPPNSLHNTKIAQHESNVTTLTSALSSHDAQEIAHQLKRLADINYEALQFEIARFKFNNPGFHYNPPSL